MSSKVRTDRKGPKPIRTQEVFRLFHSINWACLHCGRRVRINAAHLVGRGAGGDDVMNNLVPLCGSGTEGCHGAWHGNPYTDQRGLRIEGAHVKASVGRWLRSEEGEDHCAYLISKLGPYGAELFVQRLEGRLHSV